MKVLDILLRNFMTHENVNVSLPEKGVIAITGPNGHGKSALIEAVPAVLWNETLRGTAWHNPGKTSSVTLLVQTNKDAWSVRRTKNAGGGNRFELLGGDRKFDTAGKAETAMQAAVGSFDVWRRTHVFSSSDDAHFSRATDGKRKVFMETILGLDKFDRALKACKADLKKQQEALEKMEGRQRMAATRQEAEHRRIEEAKRTLRGLKSPGEAPTTMVSAHAMSIKTLQSVRDDMRQQVKKVQGEISVCNHKHEESEKRAKKFSDLCPTCAQPIPESKRAELRQEADEAFFELEKVKKVKGNELERLEALLEEYEEDIENLRAQHAKDSAEQRLYQQLTIERTRLEHVIEEATKASQEYLEDRNNADTELGEIRREVTILKACSELLGLKGVRANITTDTLSAMESIANHWMDRLTGGQIELAIKPYRELKSKKGEISDEWSMEVIGAGGGFGYEATSAGQRQRIDIALLFGSAQVAQAAFGVTDGTMFFDEVFDHLDVEGTYAVVEALDELASERAIVVISHSDALVEAMQPALHLHVENGKVITR